MRLAVAAFLVLALVPSGWAQLAISGAWEPTLQLLPVLGLQRTDLTLTATIAHLTAKSESTFRQDGLRYQSLYLAGRLGECDLEGKIYFHAREARYRRAWANLETAVSDGVLHISARHWSSSGEYTSSDKDKFGAWPCANAIPWHEAWQHIGRTLYIEGPVVGYDWSGPLKLYLGRSPPDPERFEVYISASNVLKFEEAFGPRFWEGLVGKIVCVRGTIKDARYTAPPAHSVPQVALSSASDLAVGSCCGLRPAMTCPGPIVLWYKALDRVGETVFVQGPVVSVTSPTGYRRLRLGGGATVPNRLEVYIPEEYVPLFQTRFGDAFPGNTRNRTVCVRGLVGTGLPAPDGVARIVLIDPEDLRIEPCCEAALHAGGLFIGRIRLAWSPWTFTVDLSDCGTGLGFLQATAALKGYPLCCGLRLDLALTFSKCRALDALDLTLGGLSLGCCGLTAEVGIAVARDAKVVTVTPRWPRISGCFTVYGDLVWTGSSFAGISLYGWGVSCALKGVKLRLVTALDPDAVEDMTDITFYADEFEYLGVTYRGGGCSGGTVESSLEFWWGAKGSLFGLQRVRLKLTVPLGGGIEFKANGQWNFAKADPVQWFDVGLEIPF